MHSARVFCGEADWVTVFTGAGFAPTFRGSGGRRNFARRSSVSTEAFLENPDLVWQWYAHRRAVMAEVQPNAGHTALARMERLVPGFAVITQNIDNLLRAGSRTVDELHGNIEPNFCSRCGGTVSHGERSLWRTGSTGVLPAGAVRPDVGRVESGRKRNGTNR